MSVTLILACAGKGNRAGFEKNKLLVDFGGSTCLERTLSAFIKSGLIDQYIVTASEEDYETVKKICSPVGATVILGGATRTESVYNGLSVANGDVVLIHDGARPFVTLKMIEECITTARNTGSAIPVIPTRNTVVTADGEYIESYLGKSGIYSVQTPQGFITEQIKDAYSHTHGRKGAHARTGANAGADNINVFNDDGEVYKLRFGKVNVYAGDAKNVKLTYPEDFETLYCASNYRFGTGFDCHKLVEGRALILGGITIPHDKGLLGHSDADVLTHAIMDALLSSVAERDIGYHFPDTDEKYKGANSIELLKQVLKIVDGKGYVVDSVSACIMAQKPKLLPHIPTITKNLSTVLGISPDKIGITATTLEGLGFVGREEGICVHANATVKGK